MSVASSFSSIDASRTRMAAFRHSLQTADQILSGLPIRLSFEAGLPYPELTLGNHITVKADRAKDDLSDPAIVMSILGTNYHGLAHSMYSTVSTDEIWKYFKNSKKNTPSRPKNFDMAYNILEDARIETIIGAKYNRMRKYFTSAVSRFLYNDQNQWDIAFLLTHGRKYLPQDLRDFFEEKFSESLVNKGKKSWFAQRRIKQYKEIIDKYRLLPLTRVDNIVEAGELINRFATMMSSDGVSLNEEHGADEASPSAKSRKSMQDQESDAERAKQQEGNADDAGDDGGDDQQDGARGEDQSPGQENGSGGGQDQDDAEQGQADGDDQSGGQPDDEDDVPDHPVPSAAGNQSGKDAKQKLTEADASAVLSDLIEISLNDQEVQEEVRGFQEAMDDVESGLESRLPGLFTRTNLADATPEMVFRSTQVSREFQKIWARMDPGWEYDLPDGNRIDMQRAALAIEPEDYETIYVDWNPGQQESSGTEIVILGDRSSSMDAGIGWGGPRRVVAAFQGVWELLRAATEVGAHCTVLSFEYQCHTVYSRGEEPDRGKYRLPSAVGGTNPLAAIQEARRILHNTDQPNKLLAVFTDGEWPQDGEIQKTLSEMHDTVKLAILINDGNSRREGFRYKGLFDVVATTNGEILEPIARTVQAILERNVQ